MVENYFEDPMSFVELERSFVQIARDQEPNFELGRVWGRKLGGWYGWRELRECRRVVVLAEALSGKSTEFRNQAEVLRGQGHPAFFVTIEELADHGFEAALEPGSVQNFEKWQLSTRDAWFFLDSVDEARLNRKSFELALKRFRRDLGDAFERARVLVSCRVSDWRGSEDHALIERLLPLRERPREEEAGSSPLLDPIFKHKKQSSTRLDREREQKFEKLLIVVLAPLSLDQCSLLAAHLGVDDPDAFIRGITLNGLDAFAERPGDVVDLAHYWKSFARFGAIAEMVEHGVSRKLSERDGYRPDNDLLSPEKAREGAERVAAALTLGKSFNLRAPGHDSDPSPTAGLLDPTDILVEWTEAERNALLRRGAFAPAIFGRIRFHHRATQEYLTASWLRRLLNASGEREEVWDLFFASRYGIDTVVPSLRPAAAWLALWDDDVRNEIIAREPLVLIRHGDPGSLPIETRSSLLRVYAAKHASSEISDDYLDSRAIWMFADQRLANAIRQAWIDNPSDDFRLELLRIIREGRIAGCVDLARDVALSPASSDYHRVVAIQALVECEDDKSLVTVTQSVLDSAVELSPSFSVGCAKALFPRYLKVSELFTLIEKTRSTKPLSSEGYGYAILDLFQACPDSASRREFVSRLADLCLTKPFADEYHRVSKRSFDLASHVEPIVTLELQALRNGEPTEDVIRLLMVVERADRYPADRDEPTLSQVVYGMPKVKRALLWADVAEHRTNSSDDRDPISFRQILLPSSSLWRLNEGDLAWLYEDLQKRPDEAERRIALSSVVGILYQADRLQAELPRLKSVIGNEPTLTQDLAGYLTPLPPPSPAMRRHEAQIEAHRRRHAEQEEKAKESWRQFEKNVRENPEWLRNPDKLRSWPAGGWRLWQLTRWLASRVPVQDQSTPRQWRLLAEAFGREVAEAYRDGLKLYWRLTEPTRPKHQKGGRITTKFSTILAFGAIDVEAAEDPDWTSSLSDDEASRAALHGCLSEQGYPDWIETLIVSHPHVVVPAIENGIRSEYSSIAPSHS
jgi:hypothetical protein